MIDFETNIFKKYGFLVVSRNILLFPHSLLVRSHDLLDVCQKVIFQLDCIDFQLDRGNVP